MHHPVLHVGDHKLHCARNPLGGGKTIRKTLLLAFWRLVPGLAGKQVVAASLYPHGGGFCGLLALVPGLTGKQAGVVAATTAPGRIGKQVVADAGV